ncbi:MAG: S41 family peptidase [Bacteroidota bacterium]
MKWLLGALGVFVLVVAATGLWAQQRGLFDEAFYERSPFEATRWSEDLASVDVHIGDTWYRLASIAGHTADDVIISSQRRYGEDWQKRIDEDLPMVLLRMGWWPGDAVDVEVVDLASGETLPMRDLPLTVENRVQVRAGRRAEEDARLLAAMSNPVPRSLAIATLNDYQEYLDEAFAYAHANNVDYAAALDSLRASLGAQTTGNALGLAVQQVMARFIDGHAGVSGFAYPPGALPFAIDAVQGGYAAFRPDRSAFIHPDHPYVVALDGVPIGGWLEAASAWVVQGSPQYQAYGALRHLRRVNHLRTVLGLPLADSLAVTLADLSGASRRTLAMPVQPNEQRAVRFPQRESQVLDGNIGYLRLEQMNEDAVENVETWMPQFEQTDGLIIDVRGNTGGSRDALRALFPYFMADTDPPHVANAAQYRLSDDLDDDHLQNRYMHRATSKAWSADERAAIEAFAQAFQPEWMPPQADFSAWHYLVLSHDTAPHAYTYTAPVVILMDEKCFSATDIFLSAFKGWRDVTLMGQPSGGGSARSRTYTLEPVPLMVRMATMASFQRDGTLYDGRGIQPDIVLQSRVTDLIQRGTDTLIDAALAHLAEGAV